MSMQKNLAFVPALFLLVTFVLVNKISTPAFALQANYGLEIIQPQSGLDTKNRYYKAYPGLVYNVRIGVIGGVYPFSHELITGPSGMTIDAFTGEITWNNPPTSESLHTVVAKVTDAEATEKTVEWTIAVTTSGFRFIDAVNGTLAGQGGDGSIGNPWKSPADFYETKWASTYAEEFLYFRNGTYDISEAPVEDGWRMALSGNLKPNVWLAYPGESPVLYVNDSVPAFYGTTSDVYIDGFKFESSTNNGQLRFAGSANNVVIRKCLFDMNDSPGTGSNTSNIMSTNWGAGGQYWAIQDNVVRNTGGDGFGILGYYGTKVLVENNTVYNINGHGISPKHGNAMWFIRGNHVTSCSRNGIKLMEYDTSRDIEVSYNFSDMPPSAQALRIRPSAIGGPVHVLRNTFVGRVEIYDLINDNNGPFYIYKNIIINEESGNKITYKGDRQDRIIVNDNLLGVESDNIIDRDGSLTEAYLEYYGTHGRQVIPPSAAQEISAPRGFRIM